MTRTNETGLPPLNPPGSSNRKPQPEIEIRFPFFCEQKKLRFQQERRDTCLQKSKIRDAWLQTQHQRFIIFCSTFIGPNLLHLQLSPPSPQGARFNPQSLTTVNKLSKQVMGPALFLITVFQRILTGSCQDLQDKNRQAHIFV